MHFKQEKTSFQQKRRPFTISMNNVSLTENKIAENIKISSDDVTNIAIKANITIELFKSVIIVLVILYSLFLPPQSQSQSLN